MAVEQQDRDAVTAARPVGGDPPTGRAPRRRRWVPDFTSSTTVVWLIGAIALVGYPLYGIFRRSFQTRDGALSLQAYVDVATEAQLLLAAWNSTWLAGLTTVGAILIGVPLAYLVSRTDLPWKRGVRVGTILTFAAPSFITAMGWMVLFGPRAGILNTAIQGWLGLEQPPFNIFSPWGVLLVLVLFLYPLVFLPVAAAFDNMNVDLEQAAVGLGAGRWTVLRRITLPLVIPAIMSGALLVFVNTFVIFGPVALLGNPVGFETIPTVMLSLMRFPPRLEMAAVMGVPALLVLASLLYLERRVLGRRSYAIISGKPGRRPVVALGRWRPVAAAGVAALFVVSLGLPFGSLLLTSFRRSLGSPLSFENLVFLDNYQRLLDQPRVVSSFTNSLTLAVAGVTLSLLFALVAAWLVERSRSPIRPVVTPTMLSPLAFQGAILGIALTIGYAPPPFRLGGSLTILLIAYVTRTAPLAFAYVQSGMKQVGPEVEEASRSLGAGWITTWRRITLPLLRNPILSVALMNFVLLFRELEISIFLYTGRNDVASVILWNLATENRFQLMGAFSVVILVINIAVVVFAARLVDGRVRA